MKIPREQLPTDRNDFEKIKSIIEDSRWIVEREFNNGKESWMACFGRIIFRLDRYLILAKWVLSTEDYKKAEQKLEEMKTTFFDMKDQHPEYLNRENIPNKEEQGKLFTMANIFSE